MPAEAPRHIIFGDWGSTAMRLNLYRVEAGIVTPLGQVRSHGIKFAGDPEAAFFGAASDWIGRYPGISAMLAGMVGSNRGWVEAPYIECPAAPARLIGRARWTAARGHRIAILPGMRCTNIFGLPDVMRGEETQIAGWIAQHGAGGRHLLCLPGTHAKWAVVENGRIVHFFTSMQGELYDILLKHSLLATAFPPREIGPDDPAYLHGLATIAGQPALAIEHAIFAARAMTVTEELAERDAPALLSGLLICADIRDACRALDAAGQPFDAVSFIGAPALTGLYAAAATKLGLTAKCMDADTATSAAADMLLPHFPEL